MGQIAKLSRFARSLSLLWVLLVAAVFALTSGLVFAADDSPHAPDYREIRGLSRTEACAVAKEIVAPGDVVLTEINNYVFRNIARLTASWTSHVGIIYRDPENGEWMVWESTTPRAKRSKLCEYLSGTNGVRFAIRRPARAISAGEFMVMREAAEARMGIPYDFGFNYDSDKQFCSKLVYQVFLEATGVEIGKLETFEDLRRAQPDIDYTFAEVWFGGQIPWERVTVTPASQYNDGDLLTVLESFN